MTTRESGSGGGSRDPSSDPDTNTTTIGSWYQRTNKKVLTGIVVILVAVTALMVTSLGDALTYYNTVDELKEDGPRAFDERRRVGGRVLTGTIQKDAQNNLEFTIYHNEITNTLPVRYRGVTPDIFGEEVDVIVEGEWRGDGVFYATNLIAQHPPEFQIAEPGTPHEPVNNRPIQ